MAGNFTDDEPFPGYNHSSVDVELRATDLPLSLDDFIIKLTQFLKVSGDKDFYQLLHSLSDMIDDQIKLAVVRQSPEKKESTVRFVMYYCESIKVFQMLKLVNEVLDCIRSKSCNLFHNKETNANLFLYMEQIMKLIRVSIVLWEIIFDLYTNTRNCQEEEMQIRGELLVHKYSLVRRFLTRTSFLTMLKENKSVPRYVSSEIEDLMPYMNRVQNINPYDLHGDGAQMWAFLREKSSTEKILNPPSDVCPICAEAISKEANFAIIRCLHFTCVPCMERLACNCKSGSWKCPCCREAILVWTTQWTFKFFHDRNFSKLEENDAESLGDDKDVPLLKEAKPRDKNSRDLENFHGWEDSRTATLCLWSPKSKSTGKNEFQKWLNGAQMPRSPFERYLNLIQEYALNSRSSSESE